MTAPSLDQLQADADTISAASPNTRKFAQDTVAYLRSLAPPTPTPTPPPVVFGSALPAPPKRPTTTPKLIPAGANMDNVYGSLSSTGNVVLQLQGAPSSAQVSHHLFSDWVWAEPAPGAVIDYHGATHGLDTTYCSKLVFADSSASNCGNCGVKVDAGSTDIAFVRFGVSGNKNQGLLASVTCKNLSLWDCVGHDNGSAAFGGLHANQCHNFYLGDVDGFLIANLLSTKAGFGSNLQLGGAVRNGIVTCATLDSAYGPYSSGLEIYTMTTQTPMDQNVRVLNTLLTRNHYYGAQASGTNPYKATVTLDHVLGFGNGPGDFYPGNEFVVGSHTTHADPLYASASGYHLQADSPAIGKGDPALMPAYDIEGKPRVRPALGAFAA